MKHQARLMGMCFLLGLTVMVVALCGVESTMRTMVLLSQANQPVWLISVVVLTIPAATLFLCAVIYRAGSRRITQYDRRITRARIQGQNLP